MISTWALSLITNTKHRAFIPPLQNVGEGEVKDTDGDPHTKMLAKAKSMMSKLVAKPLAKMLVKAVLLIAKVDGEAHASMLAKVLLVTSKSVAGPFVKNIGLVGVEFAKVNGEAPRQNVSEGVVADTEVNGQAPHRNSTKVLNSGSLNF
jgi:hypothetical protein